MQEVAGLMVMGPVGYGGVGGGDPSHASTATPASAISRSLPSIACSLQSVSHSHSAGVSSLSFASPYT